MKSRIKCWAPKRFSGHAAIFSWEPKVASSFVYLPTVPPMRKTNSAKRPASPVEAPKPAAVKEEGWRKVLTAGEYATFVQQDSVHVVVGTSTMEFISGAQNGAFVKQNVPGGSFLGFYDAEKRWSVKDFDKEYGDALMPYALTIIGSQEVVNPKPENCKLANANHKRAIDALMALAWGCTTDISMANAAFRECEYEGKLYVAVTATRDIKAGEEIFADYGTNYFLFSGNSAGRQISDGIFFYLRETLGLDQDFHRQKALFSADLVKFYNLFYPNGDFSNSPRGKDQANVSANLTKFAKGRKHTPANPVFIKNGHRNFKLNPDYRPYDTLYACTDAADVEAQSKVQQRVQHMQIAIHENLAVAAKNIANGTVVEQEAVMYHEGVYIPMADQDYDNLGDILKENTRETADNWLIRQDVEAPPAKRMAYEDKENNRDFMDYFA